MRTWLPSSTRAATSPPPSPSPYALLLRYLSIVIYLSIYLS